MATKSAARVDAAALQEALARQFRNLHPSDPSQWPVLPRSLLLICVALAVVLVLWFTYLNSFEEELAAEQAKEAELRKSYQTRMVKAVNLEALKKQREQIQQYVTQLEKQLPSKAEMAALLTDINQAGSGRGLQFELFKPAQVVVKDYYAELPIDIKVTGSYHDIGAFAGDMANLSRIVTLNNMALSTGKDGVLTLEAVAKTFRYLDPEEVQAQRKAAADKKKAAKKS